MKCRKENALRLSQERCDKLSIMRRPGRLGGMGQFAKAIALQSRINHSNLKGIKSWQVAKAGGRGGNDYGINVLGKVCVFFAPSVTEVIKVIQNLQQEVTSGGN